MLSEKMQPDGQRASIYRWSAQSRLLVFDSRLPEVCRAPAAVNQPSPRPRPFLWSNGMHEVFVKKKYTYIYIYIY